MAVMGQVLTQVNDELRSVVAKLKERSKVWGRGSGGRQMSLAVTNAEQALMWLEEAVKESNAEFLKNED